MILRTVILVAALAVGTLFSQSAVAQQALPGDPCPTNGLMTQSTGPEISGVGHFMLCVGSTWRSLYSFNNSAQITRIGDQTCATNEILKFNGTTWACAADAGGSVAADSLDFDDFIDAMTLDASTSIAGGNAFGLSLTSDLTAGGRSTSLLSLSQPDNATNNNTAPLMALTNSDALSSPVLRITQGGNGVALDFTSGGTGSSAIRSTIYYTNGAFLEGYASGLTSGQMLSLTGLSTSSLSAFTGDIVEIAPVRTHLGATVVADTGNYLDISRANAVNNAGGTYNNTGDLVRFRSTMTQTAGTITDSSSILSVSQNYAGATGDVFELVNAGTGLTMRVNDDGTTGDTTPFIVDNSGNVAIQKTTAATALDVNGTVTATAFSGSGASLTSLNASNLSSGTVGTARLGSGTANSSTFLRGDGTWASVPGGGVADTQTFNASGTWTKPSGLSANAMVFVRMWGGGGSGGSNTGGDGGGGGGGGGYNEFWIPAASLNATEAVTVGAGGASVTNVDGNAGGTTSFKSRSVGGGAGGLRGGPAGNGGGGGSGGDPLLLTVTDNGGSAGAQACCGNPGGNGGTHDNGGGGGGGGTAGAPAGGNGGNAVNGGGGGGGASDSGTGGAGGTSLTGGSGGAGASNGGAAGNGTAPGGGGSEVASGTGAAGRVIAITFN